MGVLHSGKCARLLSGLFLACICTCANLNAMYEGYKASRQAEQSRKEAQDVNKLTKAGYEPESARTIVKEAQRAGEATYKQALANAPKLTKDVVIAKIQVGFQPVKDGFKNTVQAVKEILTGKPLPPKPVAAPYTPSPAGAKPPRPLVQPQTAPALPQASQQPRALITPTEAPPTYEEAVGIPKPVAAPYTPPRSVAQPKPQEKAVQDKSLSTGYTTRMGGEYSEEESVKQRLIELQAPTQAQPQTAPKKVPDSVILNKKLSEMGIGRAELRGTEGSEEAAKKILDAAKNESDPSLKKLLEERAKVYQENAKQMSREAVVKFESLMETKFNPLKDSFREEGVKKLDALTEALASVSKQHQRYGEFSVEIKNLKQSLVDGAVLRLDPRQFPVKDISPATRLSAVVEALKIIDKTPELADRKKELLEGAAKFISGAEKEAERDPKVKEWAGPVIERINEELKPLIKERLMQLKAAAQAQSPAASSTASPISEKMKSGDY